MILEMHFAFKGDVAPGMGIRDRLIVGVITEMLAVKVLFEVAVSPKGL